MIRRVFRAHPEFRRVGRVAEGAPLLRAYRLTPIEGSNPSLSATNLGDSPKPKKPRFAGLFGSQAGSLAPSPAVFALKVQRGRWLAEWPAVAGLAAFPIIASSLKARAVDLDTKICKVSLVGVGMRSHAGIASKMFKALAQESINIQIITTSEIKISVVIEEKYLELAVRALHSAFELGDPDGEHSSS